MKLPELPPGCALDPGWDRTSNRPMHGHPNARKAQQGAVARWQDPDDLEALAAAQALREARIELWRDLYQRMTTAEQRIAACPYCSKGDQP